MPAHAAARCARRGAVRHRPRLRPRCKVYGPQEGFTIQEVAHAEIQKPHEAWPVVLMQRVMQSTWNLFADGLMCCVSTAPGMGNRTASNAQKYFSFLNARESIFEASSSSFSSRSISAGATVTAARDQQLGFEILAFLCRAARRLPELD